MSIIELTHNLVCSDNEVANIVTKHSTIKLRYTHRLEALMNSKWVVCDEAEAKKAFHMQLQKDVGNRIRSNRYKNGLMIYNSKFKWKSLQENKCLKKLLSGKEITAKQLLDYKQIKEDISTSHQYLCDKMTSLEMAQDVLRRELAKLWEENQKLRDIIMELRDEPIQRKMGTFIPE